MRKEFVNPLTGQFATFYKELELPSSASKEDIITAVKRLNSRKKSIKSITQYFLVVEKVIRYNQKRRKMIRKTLLNDKLREEYDTEYNRRFADPDSRSNDFLKYKQSMDFLTKSTAEILLGKNINIK